MKILLLSPIATKEELWGDYSKGTGAYLPLGLLSIAGVVREEGYDVKILDAANLGTTQDEYREYLLKEKFDVIGIGMFYTALSQLVFRTAQLSRMVLPESKIVAGGVHATLFPSESLEACPEVDFVVHGQGEYTFVELVNAFASNNTDYDQIKGIAYRSNNGIKLNEPRLHIANPESLPLLPLDLLQMDTYKPPPSNYLRLPTYGLVATQGCPYRCIYCDTRVHGRKFRNYGTDKLMRQIRVLVNDYGAKGLIFQDSVFTLDKTFVRDLCNRILQEKLDISWTCYTRVDRVDPDLLNLMKKAGCWSISYGLESGNPESLKLIKKNASLEQAVEAVKWTKQAKIQVIGSFILCLPGEDEQMSLNTINFAKDLELDTAVFFLPVPFPGTELYDICKADGGLIDNIQWTDYKQWVDQSKPLYINPKIGKEKMVEIYEYALQSFYISPKTVLKAITHIRSISDVKKYITGFRSIAGIIKRSYSRRIHQANRLSHIKGR